MNIPNPVLYEYLAQVNRRELDFVGRGPERGRPSATLELVRMVASAVERVARSVERWAAGPAAAPAGVGHRAVVR